MPMLKQLRAAVDAAYQHGPQSWTSLLVMLSIIDPQLQAQYIDKCSSDQVHFEIVKHLLMMTDVHVPKSNYLDKQTKEWMKDTLKSLFSKEDFLDGHTLEFVHKVLRLLENEINSLFEFEET